MFLLKSRYVFQDIWFNIVTSSHGSVNMQYTMNVLTKVKKLYIFFF